MSSGSSSSCGTGVWPMSVFSMFSLMCSACARSRRAAWRPAPATDASRSVTRICGRGHRQQVSAVRAAKVMHTHQCSSLGLRHRRPICMSLPPTSSR